MIKAEQFCSWKKLVSTAIGAALLTASVAHGAGFAIYETSTRGFAMGNANVGRNDDASALYSNPAAITQLEGTQFVAGVAFISPSVDVTTTYNDITTGFQSVTKTTAMNSYTELIPHIYATHRFGENLGVGLAIYVPYGLKSDFPEDWPGRYNNYLTDIKTIDINPNVAYRIVHDLPWARQISVAVGVQALYVDVDLRRFLPPAGVPAAIANQPLILQGDSWEIGYNAAVQWEINEKVALGVVYRSGFKAHVTGATEQIGSIIKTSGAEGKINLPDSWSFGLNYTPIAPLNIGVQALWTDWADYDTLTITTPHLGTIAKEKNWNDVWRYSIGAEYQISNPIALRAGFVYDKDPVNPAYADYMVPSNDRVIVSVGLGWKISKMLTVDAAYGYLTIKSRHLDARGPAVFRDIGDTFMHTGHAHIFSVSANCRF